MLDPPWPEACDAIATCMTVGICVICITGDKKGMAKSICRSIRIFDADEDLMGKSYTSHEFDDLSHVKKVIAVQKASLFSHMEPNHKVQLVDLLQGLGLIIAMVSFVSLVSKDIAHTMSQTDDGVNDMPALKKANISMAMGSGTDVAKLTADIVLADSNFATIEKVVEEGGLIYNNTKQFILLRLLPTCSSR
jgi:Ca2+ transporting ATPase